MSETTPTPDEKKRPARRIGRFFARVFLLGVVPLVAIATGLYFYYTGGRYISTENAYVRAEIIAISTDIDARVTAVNVTNNQRVLRGSELFRLDPEPFRLMVSEAQAEMQLAQVSIDTMRADYREAVASRREASQQVRHLQSRLDRQTKLKDRGIVTAEKHDEALYELQAAKQRVSTLNQRARRALANLGGDIEIAHDKHPAYKAAQSRLDLARTRERQTVVLAPADGIVSNMQLQAGEFVQQGKPIFSLVNDNDMWVEANLKETQLTHIKTGQIATLSVDAYPDVLWEAVVSDIAPATGAEFSLLPPQNATGNWVKVVQRVPVRLRIKPQPDGPQLRAGMTVTAEIDTQRERGWPTPFGIETGDVFKSAASIFSRQPPVTGTVVGSDEAVKITAAQSTTPTKTPSVISTASAANREASFESATIYNGNWLQRQNANQYTIQIGHSHDRDFLLSFAQSLTLKQAMTVYRHNESNTGKQPYGLITGLYPSVQQARTALAGLPKPAKRYGPWVRKIGELQRVAFGVANRAASGQ